MWRGAGVGRPSQPLTPVGSGHISPLNFPTDTPGGGLVPPDSMRPSGLLGMCSELAPARPKLQGLRMSLGCLGGLLKSMTPCSFSLCDTKIALLCPASSETAVSLPLALCMCPGPTGHLSLLAVRFYAERRSPVPGCPLPRWAASSLQGAAWLPRELGLLWAQNLASRGGGWGGKFNKKVKEKPFKNNKNGVKEARATRAHTV